ncbi:MAG: SMC family ATPase, partial [Lachnospiraceae bacterium]|nr:SMC family ATPase [Lachnospiraceae bacterium]
KSKKTKEALTAETNSLKDEYSGLEDVSALLEKSRAGIEKLNTEKEETMKLTDALKSFFGDREKLERLKDDYVQKDDLFRQLNHAYETMDQAFMDGQAGILAGKLKDGERCPVCGSLSHPEPASLAENVPTQAELKEAKLAAEKARSEREKASSLAGGHDKALSLKEEELKAMTLKMIKTDDLQTALGISEEKTNKLVDQIRQEAATVSELEAGLKRKEELSGLIREKEHKLDNLSNVIGELSIKITGDEAAQKETALRIGEIKKELEYENRDLAVEQINNARKHAKMLQKAYDKTREDLNAQSSIVEGLKREIESLEKTISETKADDTDRMKERQIALNEKLRECRDKRDTVSGKIRSNEDIRSRIIKKAEGIDSIEKKLQWIGALSKTANGQLAGKEKIMLETYIQTTYFDRIIRRANLRLLTMSSGQYELIRLKEAGNVKSQSGLELGVTDHYNGTQRSVRTLSGGESFMASLSLALGLSDEVQSSAGGIQIDTMFVDEGFGSLDPGALDQAYKALCSLAEGNRLVGIISHVADLKARVDKQIVVTKSMSKGSDVKLIV